MNAQASSPDICPYDLCAVDPSAALVCPGCGHLYHQECWDELGGCAVMGCPRMVEVKKPEGAPEMHWGETSKACPFCLEKIPVSALDCPFCKSQFGDSRPLSRESFLPKPPDPVLDEIRKQAKTLLVFSILGITSPLALLFGWLWYKRNQDEIKRAGSTTYALTIVALAINVVYLAMVGLGIIAFGVVHK
jgi:hypothetical protein